MTIFNSSYQAFHLAKCVPSLVHNLFWFGQYYLIIPSVVKCDIILLRAMAVFCGTDNILWNIPHIQTECEEYSIKYS